MHIALGYPIWVRLTHWFNLLFFTLLVRSGLSILAAHPKLYWNASAEPGSEWLRFTKKQFPKDRLWCTSDEEVNWPGWLCLPGGESLGLGRYWHFFNATGWMLTGLFYLVLMFFSPEWRRLIPTSWKLVPDAWHAVLTYLHLRLPPSGNSVNPLHPMNALQQLTYFAMVFVLAPFQILMGFMQSPAILARWPDVFKVLRNRQMVRSLHFLGGVALLIFLAVHVLMVLWHGFAKGMDRIVLGSETEIGTTAGLVWGIAILVVIGLVHVAASWVSRHRPHQVQRALDLVMGPIITASLGPLVSIQKYSESDLSPYFRVNGYPPVKVYPQARGYDGTYERLLERNFKDYRLEVRGLVTHPLKLSLDDIRSLPRQKQRTLHHCIQGWTSIGKWTGVRVSKLLELCDPSPEARFLAFYSFGLHERSGTVYYECIDLKEANNPQTIVAYELNDEPLPPAHGAPLRLRIETRLGFKMVKFIRSIELIEDFRKIGAGMGGSREDEQYYDMHAFI